MLHSRLRAFVSHLVFRRLYELKISRAKHKTSASCWRNDGASKKNLHFDDPEVNKLFPFFRRGIFSILRNKEKNMFCLFQSC